LTTLLLQPSLPSLVIIDEPELGLHPYAINLLADMLHSASTKAQVIVSTQSVPLVNQFMPEDVIVVDREGDQSEFRRLNVEKPVEWLEDYSLGELWEKNVIGGRP
jgi:predicted ATPase